MFLICEFSDGLYSDNGAGHAQIVWRALPLTSVGLGALLFRVTEAAAEVVLIFTFSAEAKQRPIKGVTLSVQEKFRQAKRWDGWNAVPRPTGCGLTQESLPALSCQNQAVLNLTVCFQ